MMDDPTRLTSCVTDAVRRLRSAYDALLAAPTPDDVEDEQVIKDMRRSITMALDAGEGFIAAQKKTDLPVFTSWTPDIQDAIDRFGPLEVSVRGDQLVFVDPKTGRRWMNDAFQQWNRESRRWIELRLDLDGSLDELSRQEGPMTVTEASYEEFPQGRRWRIRRGNVTVTASWSRMKE